MHYIEIFNHEQVIHDGKESFLTKPIQSNSISSDVNQKKQNFFSEILNFFNVGFGVSNMDSVGSDCDYIE